MNQITENPSHSILGVRHIAIQGNGEDPMRTSAIVTVATVVLAFLIVAESRTVGLTGATGSSLQNTMSIHDLDVGLPTMKNLPVQEIPLP